MCVHVSACVLTERSGWQSEGHFWVFFPPLLPCSHSNKIVYTVHSHTCISLFAASKCYILCFTLGVWTFSHRPILECLPLFKSIICVFNLFFPHSGALSLSSPLTCVTNLITFNGWPGVKIGSLVGERVGGKWVCSKCWEEKWLGGASVCVPNYQSSQPKVTFTGKACTHS